MTNNAKETEAQPAKPLKIHVGKTGGVKVDAEKFFAHPEVQRKMAELKKMDIVGKKLDFKTFQACSSEKAD